MIADVPLLKDAIRVAETKLSLSLGGVCEIRVYHNLDMELTGVIHAIDHEKFREELHYSVEELDSRSCFKGFMCLLTYLDMKPIAFTFGYDDEEEGAYFSDNAATLMERKGIGTTLSALEAIYCSEHGYRSVKLLTEEVDESGRQLRLFWERFGFRVTGFDPSKGVEMRFDLTPSALRGLYDRFIGC